LAKIKICGLSRLQDIEAVNEYKPDYIGFVFAKSKRQVNKGQAKMLKDKLLPGIISIGVFVNETAEYILNLYKEGIIDIIQLHGDEDEKFMLELKQSVPCQVIKAIPVQTREQILLAEKLPSDYLLLDTYQRGQHGGTGIAFNHSIIPELEKPFFLAGGLDFNNITDAIRNYGPYAVDISSSVETDGIKDAHKIKRMIEIVRDINN
jgi:phosphoribosylanthranilate isomerase